MNNSTEEAYQRRIAELEAENARLTKSLEYVKADRKALRDEVYGPLKLDDLIDADEMERELIERMKNHVPGSGARLMAELGLNRHSAE